MKEKKRESENEKSPSIAPDILLPPIFYVHSNAFLGAPRMSARNGNETTEQLRKENGKNKKNKVERILKSERGK